MAGRSILWRGVCFESLSEIAVSEVLEEYVAGWRLTPGVSFQVNIGSLKVDFLVERLLVEYHPFRTPWRIASQGVGRTERLQEIRRCTDRAMRSYGQKRRNSLGPLCSAQNLELVVVGSGRELLRDVVARCSTRALPPLSRFESSFERRIRELADFQNKISEARALKHRE